MANLINSSDCRGFWEASSNHRISGLSFPSASNVACLPYVRCRERIPPIRLTRWSPVRPAVCPSGHLPIWGDSQGSIFSRAVAANAACVLDGPYATRGWHPRKEKPPQGLLLLRNTDTFRLTFAVRAKPFGGKVSVPSREPCRSLSQFHFIRHPQKRGLGEQLFDNSCLAGDVEHLAGFFEARGDFRLAEHLLEDRFCFG